MRLKVLSNPVSLPSELDEFRNHPFFVFKTDDLSTPINELYKQQYQSTKKSLGVDFTQEEFNRPVLERIEYNKLRRRDNFGSENESFSDHHYNKRYRLILDTPFATDGQFIYVPTYISGDYHGCYDIKQIVIEKY